MKHGDVEKRVRCKECKREADIPERVVHLRGCEAFGRWYVDLNFIPVIKEALLARKECGAVFERLADRKVVTCILPPEHAPAAHAFGVDA
jgi:hypothetical protein